MNVIPISNITNCVGLKRKSESLSHSAPPKRHPLSEGTKFTTPGRIRLSSSHNP